MLVVGISACLLGESVRYDGGDKQNHALTAHKDKQIKYIAICPEAGCGLGVPREAMQLEGDPNTPRLLTINSRVDKTDLLTNWSKEQIANLQNDKIDGFIFKNRSPSCGLNKVLVHKTNPTTPQQYGAGLFAQQIKNHFDDLPMAQDDDMQNQHNIQKFIDEMKAYKAVTTSKNHG
ncbi:MAG: DUF523 domain-containing protein [Magnetococcales bacterium]|nr:DUF523 domain-containing protein [Magnetococcales bacterium]